MTFLTDGMAEYTDANVKAELANIFLDDSPTSMQKELKKVFAHLIPTNPVKGKKKRGNTSVSTARSAIVESTTG